jgi:hypothetical protein
MLSPSWNNGAVASAPVADVEAHHKAASFEPGQQLQQQTPQQQKISLYGGYRVANANPVGLFAFAMSGMMLMWPTMHVAAAGMLQMVGGYALLHGGVIQLVAGIFELIRGNTWGGTFHCTYSGFYISWGLNRTLRSAGVITFGAMGGRDFQDANFLYLFQWAVISLVFTMLRWRTSHAQRLMHVSITLAFLLSATGSYNTDVAILGGIVGSLASVTMVYLGAAQLAEDAHGSKWPGL